MSRSPALTLIPIRWMLLLCPHQPPLSHIASQVSLQPPLTVDLWVMAPDTS